MLWQSHGCSLSPLQAPFSWLLMAGASLLMIFILLAPSAIYNSDRLFPFLLRPNSIGFCREIPALLGQEENGASPTPEMSLDTIRGFEPPFPAPLSSPGLWAVS